METPTTTSPEDTPPAAAAASASAAAESSPSTPATSTPSGEATIMQSSTKKACRASVSSPSAMSRLEGWADLPDGLLHSIFALLHSFRDHIAFGATCNLWRSVFSSGLPTINFSTFIPPLLLRPNIHIHFPRPFPPHVRENLFPKCKWRLIDPANPTASLHCSLPLITPNNMSFIGCSYSHLIFACDGQCLLVDVFTGDEVRPPCIQSHGQVHICYGTLTAPLTSPKSHLLVSTRFSLIQWHVGSDSWSEHPLGGVNILQSVVFKGQIIAMDFSRRLFTISLAPRLTIQELAVAQEESTFEDFFLKQWLVACDDMLVLVDLVGTAGWSDTFQFNAFRLEMSDGEPARWLEVQKLENWALFIGTDARTPAFSCMNPERWGGKSNCIYFPRQSEPWAALQLGQTSSDNTSDRSGHLTSFDLADIGCCYNSLEPTWVFADMFCMNG